ncbi:MAG: asparagine synthase (glutamine-hydrolyzing) [Myxococcales bacterium]|nr:asparagine synthase (glutamine-hydrolyzing) [Myxococcales bacterium]
MCGIVGGIDLQGSRTLPLRRLWQMAHSVRHRGPDDSFAWSDVGIAMAAQRLAIQDVAHGRQPLSDPSGRVWVSQNGEIYNAEALSQDLATSGASFRSRCDTEVWPALYLAKGTACFASVRGQFAVALYDRSERTLLLGRDRIGICPLYYTLADGFLLWSSEIKGLLASGLVQAAPDRKGIDLVFTLFAAGTQRTAFANVSALRPGHFLRVKDGQISIHRYWDLQFPAQGQERLARPERLVQEEAQIQEEVTETLRRAVDRRFASDGPVASYLSGGLDSTLIAGISRSLHPTQPLSAFTVGFDGAGVDERPSASRSAALLSLQLETLVPSAAQILSALPAAVTAAEGPIMDTANACLLLLAQRVSARGFKVVLTGEGADEAMGGYVWHKSAKIMRALSLLHPDLPRWLRQGASYLATPGVTPLSLAHHFQGLRPSQLDLYEPLTQARTLLYSDAMQDALRDHNPFADLDLRIDAMKHWDPLHQALYLEYKLMLPGHLLLGKGDRVAMHAGVETRYPFLDEDFIDLVSTLSPSYKLRGFADKWLLRRIANKLLPKQIANPPKQMFKANALCELRPLPRWVEQLLSPPSLRQTGYFSVESVRRERALQALLPASWPRRYVLDGAFTALVMTQLWHHLFIGGGLCELPVWQPSPSPSDPPHSFLGHQHAL